MNDLDEPCSHTNAQPWIDISFDVKSGKPTKYGKVLWCADCKRGFLEEIPDDATLATYYDLANYYTQSSGTHMPPVKPRLADRVLTRLAWQNDAEPAPLDDALAALAPEGGRFLDIGCGNGGLMLQMKQRGFSVSGLDPDPNAREEATSKGLEVFEGNAETVAKATSGRTFDVLAMTHVLEHCRNPQIALENARACLAPGGRFYCEVPNCGAIYFQRYAQISEMLDVPRHIHFFTRTSLETLCKRSGLIATDWRFHGYTRHFRAIWRNWENRIHAEIAARGDAPAVPARTFWQSLRLIRDTAKAPAEEKFDCIGFFARAA